MYKNTGSGIVDLAKKDIACLLKEDGFSCQCGKRHRTDLKEVIIKSNALEEVPLVAKKHGGFNTFLIADKNTFSVAGKKVANLLNSHGIGICNFVFEEDLVEPTDLSLERVLAKYEIESDLVIGVGSGTINDIGKLVAKVKNVRYINVATAPSMDGFVSDTSSMVMKGVKTTVPSSTPTAIVADLDILQDAPKELIQAGFGDIMAKYTSICEWRISNIITGEYYCEEIASLMRLAVRNCVLQTEGLRNRDAKAIQNLMESLILSGIAMSFAGITRPASGIEHYFSHVWDMRALEFGTPKNFHGIQCGIGTLLSLGIYESIKRIQPQRQRALQYVRRFNFAEWSSFLREFLGEAANGLLELETKEGKYDPQAHCLRLKIILENWSAIQRVISQELPSIDVLQRNLAMIGAPLTPLEIGISKEETRKTFLVAKDIRDKYNASRLVWDLGVIEEIAESLCD